MGKKSFRSTRWRFLLLFFCASVLTAIFCYDNPAPLISQLKSKPNCDDPSPDVDHGMDLDNFEFNMLYTIYSFPNIVLPLIGGYFIDRIGKRIGIVLFGFLVLIGQFLFFLSTYIICWTNNPQLAKIIMIASRGVFGIGGENLIVTASSFVGQWFKGKELSFGLGMTLSVARISGTINNFSQLIMYKETGNSLHLGYFVGFLFTVYSMICAVCASILDLKADKFELSESSAEKEKAQVKLSDMKKFKASYWLLTGGSVFFFMGYYPFMGVVSEMLQKRFAISSLNAGFLMSTPYLVSALASPVTGAVIDRLPKTSLIACGSNALMFLCFLIFLILPQNNDRGNLMYITTLPLLLCGFAYCFYSTGLWALIPSVVDKNLLGSAYGITTSLQNLGLAVGPVITTLIVDKDKVGGNYRLLNFAQLLEVSLGLGFGIAFCIYVKRRGEQMVDPSRADAAMLQAQKENDARMT